MGRSHHAHSIKSTPVHKLCQVCRLGKVLVASIRSCVLRHVDTNLADVAGYCHNVL